MKTFILFFRLSVFVLLFMITVQGFGQQRRQGRAHQDNRHVDHQQDRFQHPQPSYPEYHHSRNAYYDRDRNHHRPVVMHHIHRPRYMYYQPYNVYYDNVQGVFFTLVGRSWIVTNQVPQHMQHVDIVTVPCRYVQYQNDDFGAYLNRAVPSYYPEY